MTSARRIGASVLVAVLVVGCGSGSTAGPSSEVPSVSAVPARGLPTGCQPIELRAPSGETVNLTGNWAGTGILAFESETAWLKQIGNCVYGSVFAGDPMGELLPGDTITSLHGRVGLDFRVGFEVVIVAQNDVFPLGEYSTVVMLIEWDDEGRLRLREDRAPGETAGRCTQRLFECVDPVIWYRVDDAP